MRSASLITLVINQSILSVVHVYEVMNEIVEHKLLKTQAEINSYSYSLSINGLYVHINSSRNQDMFFTLKCLRTSL